MGTVDPSFCRSPDPSSSIGGHQGAKSTDRLSRRWGSQGRVLVFGYVRFYCVLVFYPSQSLWQHLDIPTLPLSYPFTGPRTILVLAGGPNNGGGGVSGWDGIEADYVCPRCMIHPTLNFEGARIAPVNLSSGILIAKVAHSSETRSLQDFFCGLHAEKPVSLQTK